MLKGVKLQLKSKDTDIQRLTLKIKRLEKTNEIRDKVYGDEKESREKIVKGEEGEKNSFLPDIKSNHSSSLQKMNS